MKDRLTVGSLFSGIGGIELGLERTGGFETKWQVEIDEYCQKVLARHWPDVARHGDIRECGKHNLAPVDLICGGFPCEDISNAGKRVGIEGNRSGLWSEFYRIICELQPRYIIVENVSALLGRGMGRILGDLASCGYDAEWECLPASAFGAPHQRDRVFIVAYTHSARTRVEEYRGSGQRGQSSISSPSTLLRQEHWETGTEGIDSGSQDVPDSHGIRCNNRSDHRQRRHVQDDQEWATQEIHENRQEQLSESWTVGTILADPDRQGLAVREVFGGNARQKLTTFERSCSEGLGQWATEPDVVRVVHGFPFRMERVERLGKTVVPQVAEYIGHCVLQASGLEVVQAELEVAS